MSPERIGVSQTERSPVLELSVAGFWRGMKVAAKMNELESLGFGVSAPDLGPTWWNNLFRRDTVYKHHLNVLLGFPQVGRLPMEGVTCHRVW